MMDQEGQGAVEEYLRKDKRLLHINTENVRGEMLLARMKRGLTVKEAARLAGLDRTYYGQVEKGSCVPGELAELKIKKLLGLESLD